MENEIKSIEITNDKVVKLEKDRKKRIVSTTKEWKFCTSELEIDNQYDYIVDSCKINKTVRGQIQQKIRGYKYQDIEKELYDSKIFIDFDFVIDLLQKTKIKCFYCNNEVFIIYQYVREPRQWTIERIDNAMGHNKDNVVIACLNCNLRRRTIYYERYLMTKQLRIIKINT